MNLETLPEYLALDYRRQKITRDVAAGKSLSAACRAVGLNRSREAKNGALQACLQKLEAPTSDTAPAEESIYDAAARLEREYDAMSEDQKREYHEARAAESPTECKCGEPLVYRDPVPTRDVPEWEKYLYQVCRRCHERIDSCWCDRIDWTRCAACQKIGGDLQICGGQQILCPPCRAHWNYCGRFPNPAAPAKPPAQPAEIPPSEPRPGRCSSCTRPTPAPHIQLCSDCSVGVNW